MLKQQGQKTDDGKWTSQAAERNKGPILEVLTRILPASGIVLEIASGTGQHVIHFAKGLPALTWQPSDPDAELRRSISRRAEEEQLENVRTPVDLDVSRLPWPLHAADAILCINMIHVAPWSATAKLFDGAKALLAPGHVLYMYGPYRRAGRHTSPGNEKFDADLRAQDPEWGVRNLEEVAELGARAGFTLDETIEMPANNLSLVFRRER